MFPSLHLSSASKRLHNDTPQTLEMYHRASFCSQRCCECVRRESDLSALSSFQKRKRKEKEDETVSLSSFDLKVSAMPNSPAGCCVQDRPSALNVRARQTLILLRDSGRLCGEPVQLSWLGVIPLASGLHNFLPVEMA